MDKDILLVLLRLILKDFKRRCEQNSDEESRDTYGKWHGQIKIMIDTIERGGVK